MVSVWLIMPLKPMDGPCGSPVPRAEIRTYLGHLVGNPGAARVMDAASQADNAKPSNIAAYNDRQYGTPYARMLLYWKGQIRLLEYVIQLLPSVLAVSATYSIVYWSKHSNTTPQRYLRRASEQKSTSSARSSVHASTNRSIPRVVVSSIVPTMTAAKWHVRGLYPHSARRHPFSSLKRAIGAPMTKRAIPKAMSISPHTTQA